jgi:hypothetical protein
MFRAHGQRLTDNGFIQSIGVQAVMHRVWGLGFRTHGQRITDNGFSQTDYKICAFLVDCNPLRRFFSRSTLLRKT